MIDRRYPHLCRITDLGAIAEPERRRVQRLLDSIKSRSNWTGLYDRVNRRMYFFLGSIKIGADLPSELTDVADPVDGICTRRLDDLWAERLVRLFQNARRSWAEKDRDEERAEKARQSEIKSRDDRRRESLVPEVRQMVSRSKNRLGMSKKYRPSAVVNGLKQGSVA